MVAAAITVLAAAPVVTAGITPGASLTIIKVTDPASDAQDFDYDLTGGVLSDLDLDTDAGDASLPSQQQFNLQIFGPYTIAESIAAGWTLTTIQCSGDTESSTSLVTRTATLDVDAGETIVCTFTNAKDASVTIAKVTSPASDPQDFDFDLTSSGLPADVDLDTDAGDASLPSQQAISVGNGEFGAVTITESSTTGWILTNLVCTGAGADSSTSTVTRTATLDVDPGETIVCTFTNSKATSTITIVKVTDPASDPQDFDFDLSGGGLPSDLDLDSDAGDATLPSQETFDISAELGLYQITESASAGWILTDLTCTGAGDDGSIDLGLRRATLDIDVGEHVTCTFTNTKAAALLTIRKVTDPASDPQDFYIDTPPIGNTTLDTDPASAGTPDSETFKLVDNQLGARTATETAVEGWTLTGISCPGDADAVVDLANNKVDLDIDAGESITCTFTNTKDVEESFAPTDEVDATDDVEATVPGTDTLTGSTGASGTNVALAILALALLSLVVLVARPKERRR